MRPSYQIAGQDYSSKQAITTRCQEIVRAVKDGERVPDAEQDFLLDLLRHHTEWDSKSAGGVSGITTQTTAHGTRCLVLIKSDGWQEDISYVHAIKHLSTAGTADLLPQGLIDFRNGARQAIKPQIDAFRKSCDDHTPAHKTEVDHVYPATFDALLFRFCAKHHLNPVQVVVRELPGCIPHIEDDWVRTEWQDYHAEHSKLSLVLKSVNAALPKPTFPWRDLISGLSPAC